MGFSEFGHSTLQFGYTYIYMYSFWLNITTIYIYISHCIYSFCGILSPKKGSKCKIRWNVRCKLDHIRGEVCVIWRTQGFRWVGEPAVIKGKQSGHYAGLNEGVLYSADLQVPQNLKNTFEGLVWHNCTMMQRLTPKSRR